MKQRNLVVLGVFAWGLFGSLLFSVAPTSVVSAQGTCKQSFLTMPAWYRGLVDSNCEVDMSKASFAGDKSDVGGDIGAFILVVALNVVEILMHLAAYTAAAFIIVGGFKYMTSMGSADGNVKGRKTIMNAVIGLIISMIAITVVSYIVRTLT